MITDALSALGLTDGRHKIGQMDIEIKGGIAFVAGTNTLCGSVTSLLECVKFFHKASGKFLFSINYFCLKLSQNSTSK